MAQEILSQNTQKVHGLMKYDVFSEFAIWIATPKPERNPPTQGKFAELWHVTEWTLSEWKKDERLWEKVEKHRKKWGRERTGDVLWGLYRNAVTSGRADAAKLWLQYIEKWIPTEGSVTKDFTQENQITFSEFEDETDRKQKV